MTATIHEAPDKLGYVAGSIDRALIANRSQETLRRLSGALAGLDDAPSHRRDFYPRAAMRGAYIAFSRAYGRGPKRGYFWRQFRNAYFKGLRAERVV